VQPASEDVQGTHTPGSIGLVVVVAVVEKGVDVEAAVVVAKAEVEVVSL
jgi:hypothetical protein